MAEIFLGTNKKPQRLIWGDVIAWLLVLVLAFCVPFVMFFVAILMGFGKIFGLAYRNPDAGDPPLCTKEAAN